MAATSSSNVNLTLATKIMTFLWSNVLKIRIGILLLPLVIVMCTMFYMYRLIIQVIMYFQYGRRTTLMTGLDTAMSESYPESRMNLTSLMVLHEEFTKEVVTKNLKERFASKDPFHEGMKKMLKIPFKKYGYWFWLDNNDKFDPEYHIRTMEVPNNQNDYVTEKDMEKLASMVSNVPFQVGKPAFEFLFVAKNFVYEEEKNLPSSEIPVRNVCLFRSLHCYGDGVRMLPNFLFKIPDRAIFLPGVVKPPKLTVQSVFKALGHLSTSFADFTISDRNVFHNRRLSGDKICAMSDYVDLEDVKRLRQTFNLSISAVSLSSLGDSFYRYMKSRNMDKSGEFRIALTVAMDFPDKTDSKIENGLSCYIFRIPMSDITPLERLKNANEQLRTDIRNPYSMANKWVIQLLCNLVPSLYFILLADGGPITGFATNFAYPDKQTLEESKSILDMVPWIPNRHETGISVIFYSINGKFHFTIQTDKTIFPAREDVNELMGFWKQAMEESIALVKDKTQ